MGGGGGGRGGRGGGGGGQPAFSGRGGGGGFHSLRASGAPDGGGRGRGGRGRGGRGGGGGGRGDGSGRNNGNFFGNRDEGEQAADKAEDNPELEAAMGYPLFSDGPPEGRLGWLLNINPTLVDDRDAGRAVAAVNCYFQCQDGSGFKAQIPFSPYLYVITRPGREGDVEGYLRRKHGAAVRDCSLVSMEDLDLKNHLAGIRRRLLKVTFWTTQGLGEVRRDLLPAARKARARDARGDGGGGGGGEGGAGGSSIFGGGGPAGAAGGGNAGGAQADEGDVGGDDDDDDEEDGPSTSARVGRGGGGIAGAAGAGGGPGGGNRSDARARVADALSAVLDVREHDVPYATRFCIDTGARCGHWFRVKARGGVTTMERRADLLARADVRVLAFDIETTKLPLQFPNAEFDQIFMISYMVDGRGFLITNREVVSADCADFEYSPKPEFAGPFTVFNERDEAALLRRWFAHVRELKPAVFVTYNGDWFDFPFVANRARFHGLSIEEEIGFKPPAAKVDFGDRGGESGGAAAVASMDPSSPLYGPGEWLSRTAVHLDCLHWVNRDSYLPQGSRGLKAVTKAKLGYDPVEVDPENMVPLARSDPEAMAAYSVSDAVATFYLYLTYVHPFIFSLATIIPLAPDDVLRKGSGTLCEALLMVEAYLAGVLAPNKHVARAEKTFRGKPLESETYIGGKVEALESGVFRSDLPTRFACDPAAYQALIDSVDEDLSYALRTEFNGTTPDDLEDYEAVKKTVVDALTALRDRPAREERPLIYHLDVAAMYPNIILTNRLQPSAIVTDEDCAACDFNRPGKTCLRPMEWVWRGETYAATVAEYRALKAQLEAETFSVGAAGQIVSGGSGGGPSRGFGANTSSSSAAAAAASNGPPRPFYSLSPDERAKLLKDRLKAYCSRVYKRVLDKPVAETRVAGVCQRENDFYVGTVRAFRDRRYEYKALNKKWKGKLDAARDAGDALAAQEAADMVVLYDSLQLAHKCILNSFYGYVMRKGARWYSMEMAGVVTATGAAIIDRAAKLVRGIGAPLELDTDGIWCCLPASFPEDLVFSRKDDGDDAEKKKKKKVKVSYPCAVLNVMVARNNTNDQYQDLVDDVEATVAGDGSGEMEGVAGVGGGGDGKENSNSAAALPLQPRRKRYATSSQMSIEFEVDGPYRAMILPASKEEGRLIKKRYAVFNFDGSLAELKGFELKRRGELKLVKVFQAEVFSKFLEGDSLAGCYASVAAVADRWLDLLDSRGAGVDDDELMSYISESCTMSKALDEYEGRKSLPATTARRLAEFLGDARIKDKGLNATYVVSNRPLGAPTSERAVPVAIFAAEPAVARAFLRKWLGGGDLDDGRAPGERPDVRAVVDWDYYRERLASTVQKIVTIPAAMQRVPNPVPRVRHPEWLHRRVREKEDRLQQRRLDGFFVPVGAVGGKKGGGDIEDFGSARAASAGAWPSARKAPAAPATVAAASPLPIPPPPPPSPPQPAVERSRDPAAWVLSQKRRWRAAVAARKKRRADAAARLAAAARASGGDAHAVARLAQLDAAAAGAGGETMTMMEGEDEAAAAQRPGGVGALLARAGGGWGALAAGAHLQLLSLEGVAGGSPGELRAWALVSDGSSSAVLHSFSLRVPRTFYFASTAQPGSAELAAFSAIAGGGAVVAPARREVPFGRLPPGASLYSVTLPFSSSSSASKKKQKKRGDEDEGNDSGDDDSEDSDDDDDDDDEDEEEALDAALAAPHIVGVWERSLSPQASAALSLGCCASLAPRVRAARRSLAEGLELGDLVMRTTAECDFLESHSAGSDAAANAAAPSSASFGGLRPIPVYARFDASRGRAVLAAHCPAAGRAIVVVVTGANAASGRGAGAGNGPREVTPSIAERAWREVAASVSSNGDDAAPEQQQQQPSSSSSLLPAPPAFEVAFAADAKAGLRALQRALSDWRASHRGPAIALVSCRGSGGASSSSSSVASFVGGKDELARRLPALRSMPRVDAALSSASTAALAADGNGNGNAADGGGDAAVAVAAAAAAGDDPGEAALAGALAWQAPAAREAVAALAGARAWLRGASAAARYAHLPLSALGGGGDWRSAAADALLARTARDAGVLLWGSPLSGGAGCNGQALLAGARDGSGGVGVGGVIGGGGGSSGEEGGGGGGGGNLGGGSSLGGDASWLNSASSANASSFSAGPPSIDILRPGAYRCACVQLRLHHLLVAAVDAAPALADLDGGALDGGAGGGAAMRCLRRLVRAWVVDATSRGSRPADALLLSLGRWLRDDRRGGMYAAPLSEGALRLAGRLLAALLDALARLGAVAVAADEGSLILAAAGAGGGSQAAGVGGGGRRGLGAALAAVDYALAALRRRSDGAALFGLLQLTPARWWHALLFRDRYNYLGLRATLPEAVEATLATPGALTQGGGGGGGVGDVAVDNGDGGPASTMAAAEAVAAAAAAAEASALAAPDVDCLWTIKDYLPPAVQPAFASAVAEYLWLPWKATATAGGIPSASLSSQAQAAAAAAGGEAAQVAWLKANLNSGELGRRLLRVVADADAALGAHDGDAAHAFPELVGSHLSAEQLGSPALALTRAVCEAMSLDRRLSGEVTALRRNMLRLARAREFSSAATFRDPCATFVLRGVVCSGCGAAADLDLCRDPALTLAGSGCWRCGACGCRADAAGVEARLLDAVGAAAAAFATQDLRCVRCRGVACGHLTRACDQCGGGLELTRPPATVTTALRTLRRVARFHGFELLDEAASWLLQEG